MESLQIDQLNRLFSEVNSLKERAREISILKDEHFNIFKILRQSISEELIHSRFIFELLNPSGSHQKGETFLLLFLKMLDNFIKIDYLGSIEGIKVKEVKNEKYLGPVDHGWEEGGFLDIYIETAEFIIGIENKIYAGLGFTQLERYRNYLRSHNSNYYLLYLTLFGDAVEGNGLKKGSDYYSISYSGFIIPWLELCHQHTADNPSIRETLKQYINTIKELTGKLTNHKMNRELEKLLLENYDTALTIAKAFENVKSLKARMVYKEFESKLNEALGPEYQFFSLDLDSLHRDWSSFNIRNKNWVDGLCIYFEGKKRLVDGFIQGFLFSNCSEDTFISKVNGKIRIKKVRQPSEGNLLINIENSKYSDFNRILEKNSDIIQLAEELKDHVLATVSRLEPDALKITEAFKG
jgi:hypothetical protein